MAHREVNLTKRIQTSQGWRYCPVVVSANGRVKPDVVLVNGKPEKHPEGAYYIEWRDAGKRIRLSVGEDAADAAAMRLRKETELNNGDGSVPQISGNNGHTSLGSAVKDYLEEVELSKKPKTLAAYTTALTYFTVSADLRGSHSSRFGCEPGMSAMVAGDTSALTAVEDKQSRLRVFFHPND